MCEVIILLKDSVSPLLKLLKSIIFLVCSNADYGLCFTVKKNGRITSEFILQSP